MFCCARLSLEADRCGELSSEATELKHRLTSRDRVVVELNSELSSLQQHITQLNTNYQTALQQSQLYQQTLYVYIIMPNNDNNRPVYVLINCLSVFLSIGLSFLWACDLKNESCRKIKMV